ncbi:MAG: hypothetical protein DRO00_08250 [Thermoproteota archaeon]|nr:MAG: hypothetical protein DRO00_08250 [Candidatus Korarchaeota archaeon]
MHFLSPRRTDLEMIKRVRFLKRKTLLIAAILLAVVVLSLVIGFLTYPEERVGLPPTKAPPSAAEPSFVPMPTPPAKTKEVTGAPIPSPTPPPESAVPTPPYYESEPIAEPSTLEIVERMVIYTAQISIEVEDVEAAAYRIQSIAEGSGGFVQRISISGEERKSGLITIRVPQDKFYEVLRQIESVGNVTNKEVSGEDVTEKYIDLEARLKNAKREEERLLAILDKATDVDDILKVEKELMRVRETIETLEGQLRYLERRVEYSTISVFLEETARPPVISNVKVVEVSTTKVTIEWITDVPSTSLVEYGTTKSYGYEVYDPRPVKEHSITITGLKDSTTYHFRVKSTAYGKTATSNDYTFTTESEPWIKIPEIDWGYPIERGLWGFLVLAQVLITIFVFFAPLLVIVGPPVYYFYRRRVRSKEASEEK